MARNTKARALVWVKLPAPFADLKYGFNSGADAGDRATLGQTAVDGANVQGLIIGANNVKPGKATKLKATGSESSFYSYDLRAGLRTAGWKTTGTKVRSYRASSRSALYYVTINGVKYGWRSAKPGGTAPTGLGGATGIKSVGAGDIDIVYGCSFPKPPRATTTTKEGSSFSTFIDPSKASSLPEGWSLSGSGKSSLAA